MTYKYSSSAELEQRSELRRESEYYNRETALEEAVDTIIDEPNLLEFALVRGPLAEHEEYRKLWYLIGVITQLGASLDPKHFDNELNNRISCTVEELSATIKILLQSYVAGK